MDGKFGVMTPTQPQRCDVEAPPASTPSVNFLFAADGRYRMSTVTSGCSTPETIDLYHQCSREPSTGTSPLQENS